MARTTRALAANGPAYRLVLALDDEARAELDRLANEHGLSRAEVVRRLILRRRMPARRTTTTENA